MKRLPEIRRLCLIAAVAAASGAAGCNWLPAGPPPSDAVLLALFTAHRADIDSLRENARAALRVGPLARDPALDAQRMRIARRLGIQGGGPLEDSTRIYIQTQGRRLGRDLVEAKGFAWLEFFPPRGVACDSVASLDTLDVAAFPAPHICFRRIEGSWWLYRSFSRPAE